MLLLFNFCNSHHHFSDVFLLQNGFRPILAVHENPCYFYLFNALYIVRGQAPANVWHPGTPLQVLIAIVIWALNLGANASDTITHVLETRNFIYMLRLLFCSSVLLLHLFFCQFMFIEKPTIPLPHCWSNCPDYVF